MPVVPASSAKNKIDGQQKWYVLYVKSRSEKKVLERLEKKKIVTFLPLIKTMKQWSDRKKIVQVPLFAGYIFVFADPGQFTGIRMTEGVVNFVQVKGVQASVRNEQIDAIKKFLETGLPVESEPDHFEKGEKVRINFGPLKDCEGELIEIKNTKHFIVRVEVINQVLKVSVPAEYLEKV